MCGRFTREFTWREVHAFLTLPLEFLAQVGEAFTPSYNVAPSQASPVCRLTKDARRELVQMDWGLRPAWVDKAGLAPINARCETVATSPMFRQAFKRRRCLVPASGFYEWKRATVVDAGTGGVSPASRAGARARAGAKQPYYIRLKDAPILCFAGLWEFRTEPGPKNAIDADGAGEAQSVPHLSFTILTTRPNALMEPIHDRMPVIIDPAHFEEWLKEAAPDPALFEPFPPDRMEAFEVSTRVNSPKNNDPSLVRPIARDGLFG